MTGSDGFEINEVYIAFNILFEIETDAANRRQLQFSIKTNEVLALQTGFLKLPCKRCPWLKTNGEIINELFLENQYPEEGHQRAKQQNTRHAITWR